MDEQFDAKTKVVKLEDQPTTLTLHKCKLVVIEGSEKGKEFILDKPIIFSGSKRDNDLCLSDETVSRRHFEIRQEKGGYLLKDHESTNGTFLDGIRIKEAFLSSGSIIKVGQTEIKFLPIDEKIEIVPSKKSKFGNIIGNSIAMRKIFGIIEKIGPTDVTVIIEGETGTGKEIIAEAIHQNSRRAKKPFVVFDCSAVAENLIESELFGHEKGAFTGALTTRQGAFELSDGGTIFLDEIGELNLDLQPKLLRALEQRSVKRVGADKHINVDVRVVCATNRNLEKEVRSGRFREDLFFRLNVVNIFIPPLKERRDDIRILVNHFIEIHNKTLKGGDKIIKSIDDDAIKILEHYNWPGNVRELKNAVDRAITFTQEEIINSVDLPDHIKFKVSVDVDETDNLDDLPFKEAKDKWLESFEKDYLVKLLKRNNLNISKAAKEAQIDRKSIQRLLKKYDLKARDID